MISKKFTFRNLFLKNIIIIAIIIIAGCLGSCKFFSRSLKSHENLSSIKHIKKIAYKIHANDNSTFYCNCSYKDRTINLNSCGYKVYKNFKRSKRLEWEHIVPVSFLAKNLNCWQEPICCEKKSCYRGRACCEKIDHYYVKMATDLHNIVPEIGELNAIRSNYGFDELPHIKNNQFGGCEFKVDRDIKKVEPKESKKGIIARVYLYMADRYNLKLTAREQKLFNKWNKQYPPTLWEIEWNHKVYKVQNIDNTYISKYKN